MPAPIQPSTISRHVQGNLPELGPVLGTGQRRALLGWSHFRDNPRGLQKGKLWCWVSQPDPDKEESQPKLQVYDTEGNRSSFPGPRIDCGVANFSMVRMFHPYWCPLDKIPQDMNSEDKSRLRDLYHDLIAAVMLSYANGDHDDDSDHSDGYDTNDDDDAPARRARRAWDAEESRQIHEADQHGVRRSKAWKLRMQRRRDEVMWDEFDRDPQAANSGNRVRNLRQRRRNAARNPAARNATALSSPTQNRNGSTTSGRSRVRASLIRERVRTRREKLQKTTTPGTAGSAYQYAEDVDSVQGDDLGDIPHGGEEEDEEQRVRELRAALTRDAFLDTEINLSDGVDIGSSHRGSAEHNSDEDRQSSSSSHAMFFESANSGDSNSERPSQRHHSAGSSVAGPSGSRTRQTTGSDAGNAGLPHSALSDTSRQSIKSEVGGPSIQTMLRLFQLNSAGISGDVDHPIKVEDDDVVDDDVVVTGERSSEDPIPHQGAGSRDDPVFFD